MSAPTWDRVNAVLVLRPDGQLCWKAVRKGTRVGSVAGSVYRDGYRRVMIDGRSHAAHRLVWLLATGAWPAQQIDHINGDRADNRVSNLREATPSQNTANRRGVKGVSLHSGGKYQAQIKLHGRNHYLGLYATEDEARSAYLAASKRLHGEFGAAA